MKSIRRNYAKLLAGLVFTSSFLITFSVKANELDAIDSTESIDLLSVYDSLLNENTNYQSKATTLLLDNQNNEPSQPISNEKLEGSLYRSTHGSNYWTTSNLREWLNSEKETVNYTNQEPSTTVLGNAAYTNENGFLSNFTKEEQSKIAITNHRVYLSTPDAAISKDGGTMQSVSNVYRGTSLTYALPGLLQNYDNYYYKNEKDKVFLLNDYELYQYIQKRGWSLSKNLTETAKNKYSYYNNTIEWFINAPTENIGNEYIRTVQNDNNSTVNTNPKVAKGIVPALNLKPNAIIDGKPASDLNIGDKILFGSYLGEHIEWKVINKTDDGYPLLISERILDIKPFDAPGDSFSYEYSEYIQFNGYDVDISSTDLYKSVTNIDDTTLPNVLVLNKEELEKRQNGEFTLELSFSDSDSGIDKIILPDGKEVLNSNSIHYTFKTNKDYLFKVYDKAGNVRFYTIPVGNINPPSSVRIDTSSNGWTNQDVEVNIYASNDVGFTTAEAIQGGRDYTYYSFPNYTSYTGKKFRISGSVELIQANKDVGDLSANIGFAYDTKYENSGEYNCNYRWVTMKSIPLKDLQKNGETSFDFEATISGDYYNNLKAWTQMNIPSGENSYKLRWKNLKYELVDSDDFSISKISLPNGDEIFDNHYKDVLKSEGTYKYRVLDNRGMLTEKEVHVLIDKESPKLDVSYNSELTDAQQLTVNLLAADSQSGVKEIILPNGSTTSSLNATYNVRSNGTYTFKVKDNAGNTTTKTITVNNLDRKPPIINTKLLPNIWTNGTVYVDITATDEEGELQYIQLPNGNKILGNHATYPVNENGSYTFIAADKVGHKTTQTIYISSIDKDIPKSTYEIEHESENNYSIKLTAKDTQSGIKQIKLPNGEYVSSEHITYPIEKGGKYVFEIEDNAGNISTSTVNARIPDLNVYQKENHVQAEWGIDMLDEDVIYETGFENGEEIPNISWSSWGNGGQSFIHSDAYSGNTAIEIDDTYSVGNHINFPSTYSVYSIFTFARKYIPNSTQLSVTFKAKSDEGGIVRPSGDGGWANTITELSNIAAETAPKGTNTVKLNSITGISLGSYITTDTDPSLIHSMYQVREIDKEHNIITLSPALTTPIEPGSNLKTRPWRGAWSFSSRNIPNTNAWNTYSANTLVTNFSDYDVAIRGGTFYFDTSTRGKILIDDIKFGYATKSRLYRGNTLLYEGFLSDYEDKEAVDLAKPNKVSEISVSGKQGKTFMTIEKPKDDGTEYTYNVKAVSYNGDTISSEKKNVEVISDIAGYSYTIDKNPSTVPDNKIDAVGEEIPIVIPTNDTYFIHIKAIDGAGNVSETSHISYSDSDEPIMTLTKDTTDWTNDSVLITSTIEDKGTGVGKIQLPDGKWVEDSSATYIATKNGEYSFIGEDLAGNKVKKSINILNIDKTPPLVHITQDKTLVTNKDVVLTINAKDNESGIRRIQKPDKTWVSTDTTTYTVSKNGDYVFKIEDIAGNTLTKTYSISNIDKTPPDRPIINGTPKGFTNHSIKLKATFSADSEEKMYKIGTSDWKSYTGEIELDENTTAYFKGIDIAGNESSIANYIVDKIDKIAPREPTISLSETKWTAPIINFKISDNGDTGGSGVDEIEYRIKGGDWKPYINGSKVDIPENMSGKIDVESRVFDKAGNISSIAKTTALIDDINPIIKDISIIKDTDGEKSLTVDAVDNESGLLNPSYEYYQKEVGKDSDFQVLNGGWYDNSKLKLPISSSATKYIYKVRVRDHNKNYATSDTISYISAPKIIFGGVKKGDFDNKVTFDFANSIGKDVVVKVYREGEYIAKLVDGKQFIDEGLDYERAYNYEFVAESTFNGETIKSLPEKVKVTIGKPTLEMSLNNSVYYKTPFTDEFTVNGNISYRKGGTIALKLMKNDKEVSTNELTLVPYAKTTWKLNASQTTPSSESYKVLADLKGYENSNLYKREFDITVKEKNVTIQKLVNYEKYNINK